MKPIRFMLALFVFVSAVRAEHIALTDGRNFTDARIVSQTATHVTLRHAGGMIQVPKAVLPDSLREKYPVDGDAATAALKRDAEFKQARAKALQQYEVQLRTSRADALSLEDEKEKSAAEETAGEITPQSASAIFEMYPPGKNKPIGLYGIVAYFCTPEAWEAYQAKRRLAHEPDYLKFCAVIQAQGYDRDGFSMASIDLTRQYLRWLRKSYDELPEHFATARTNYKGTIQLPPLDRPFVMFARSERPEGEGWEHLVWAQESSGFSLGEPKKFGYGASIKNEAWAKLPLFSTQTTGVKSSNSF